MRVAHRNNCGFNSQLFLREFLFDQPMQIRRDHGMIKSLDNLVQETGDNETLRDWNRNAARAEVKQLVFFDLPGSGAVGTTDVVGKDFEPGH